jgi:Fe-S-cluster containining protein
MEITLKEKILLTIYDRFEIWASSIFRTCTKGCSVCCTQNVTMTAMEGERILDFIGLQDQEFWCAKRLQALSAISPPSLTVNEYAAACLQQQEVEESDTPPVTPCPFLDKDYCSIYPVRPFACRCFLSQSPCRTDESAIVPNYYPASAMTMMQLIEHLGQNEYWGNMLDILLSLCDILKYKKIASFIDNPSIIVQARLKTRKARPLPGFLLLEDEKEKISPLLESIFSTRINGRSIYEILNGTGKAS